MKRSLVAARIGAVALTLAGGAELTRPDEACDPLLQATRVDPSRLSLLGSARRLGDSLRLVGAADVNLVGAAWTATQIRLGGGFSSDFAFKIAPRDAAGSEGFAFVLQAEGAVARGAAGQGLGYAGITRSLAVEFDVHQDPLLEDPVDGHVSVHARSGSLPNSASESSSLGRSGPLTGPFALDDGQEHHARVEYRPAVASPGIGGRLLVFLDRAQAPALQVPIDLSDLFPNEMAYAGFTSASSGARLADVDVVDWQLGVNGPAASTTDVTVPPVPLRAGDTGEVVVQLRDACGGPLHLGGAPFTASLVTGTQSTPVQVRDNLDGTYTFGYSSLVAGQWSLGLSLDGSPIEGSPFAVIVRPSPGSPDPPCDPVLPPEPVDLKGLRLLGRAGTLDDGFLRLLGRADLFLSSAAWTPTRATVAKGFAAEFDFRIEPGAEGFAFVLQSESPQARGDAGSGMGYAGISHSLAVEFDVRPDQPSGPAFDHVSVHTRGALPNDASETFSLGTSVNEDPDAGGPFDFDDGEVHRARVQYESTSHRLRVWMDGHAAPAIDASLDGTPLSTILTSQTAFAGFTSGSSGDGASVDIMNWQLGVSGASAVSTGLLAPPASLNPGSLGEVVVQVRDACGGPLDVFSASLVTATMTTGEPEPATQSAVTDNGDGTYSYSVPVSSLHDFDGTVRLRYSPNVGGPWQLAVTLAGLPIDGSPFSVPVGRLPAGVSVTGGTFTYDGQPHPAAGSGRGFYGEVFTPSSFTYNDAAALPIFPGSYAVEATFSGNANYAAAAGSATLTITKATATVSVASRTVAYTGFPQSALGTVSGVDGELLGMPVVTYGGEATPPINVGAYEVVASFAGNPHYAPATGKGTLTITKATPSVSVTGGTFTYDGTPHAATGRVRNTATGELIGSPSLTYDGATTPPTNAGTYPVVATFAGDANYQSAVAGAMLTLAPALLTITAQDVTMVAGHALPALGASYAGFVSGDTPASLDVPATLATSATAASPAGVYPIIPSGASDANYAIAFVDGRLTVTAAPVPPPTTPRAEKTALRKSLASLLPAAKRSVERALEIALHHIDESLEPALWADASHLTRKGARVFREDQGAVETLMRIAHAPAVVEQAIARLVGVDRLLASIAIQDAKAARGDRHALQRAERELVQGDWRARRGDFGHAIQEYRQAWRHAQRATGFHDDDDDHDCRERDGRKGNGPTRAESKEKKR